MALEEYSESMCLRTFMDLHGTVMHVGLHLGFIQHTLGKRAPWSNLPRRIYTAGRDVNLKWFFPLSRIQACAESNIMSLG